MERQVVDRMQAQLRRRNSLDKYLQERDQWKQQEKERMEEEDRKIMEYAAQQQEKTEKLETEKKVKQDERGMEFQ